MFQTGDDTSQHRIVVTFAKRQIKHNSQSNVDSIQSLQTGRQELAPQLIVFGIASMQFCGLLTSLSSNIRVSMRCGLQARILLYRRDGRASLFQSLLRRTDLLFPRIDGLLRLLVGESELFLLNQRGFGGLNGLLSRRQFGDRRLII